VYQLLAAIPVAERGALRDFWRSPYFNRREELTRFGEMLLAEVEATRAADRRRLYAKLFPATAYSDQRFRLLCSDLLRLTETFLQIRSGAREAQRQELDLLRSYRQLGLHKHAAAVERRLARYLNAPHGDDRYHRLREQFLWEQYHQQSRESRSNPFDWSALQHHLTFSFLIARLRQAAYAEAYRTVIPTAEPPVDPLFEWCLAYLEREQLADDHPGIGLYYHIYRALQRPEQDHHFRYFRELLREHATLFPVEEARDLLLLAANYCIRKVNEGATQFFTEGLALYRTGLQTEVLFRDGRLSRFTYNNIVALALRNAETDWAADFIEDYRERLDPAYRDSTYAFNRARLAYELRDLETALTHLRNAEPKDTLNHLIIKTLQIRVYYELGELNLLDSHLDAMSIYLRRRKVLGYHRKNYRAIIDYTRKLLRLAPYDQGARERLRQALHTAPVLTERDWLLRMVDKAR
jgi:hypothetical protein